MHNTSIIVRKLPYCEQNSGTQISPTWSFGLRHDNTYSRKKTWSVRYDSIERSSHQDDNRKFSSRTQQHMRKMSNLISNLCNETDVEDTRYDVAQQRQRHDNDRHGNQVTNIQRLAIRKDWHTSTTTIIWHDAPNWTTCDCPNIVWLQQ